MILKVISLNSLIRNNFLEVTDDFKRKWQKSQKKKGILEKENAKKLTSLIQNLDPILSSRAHSGKKS